MRSLYSLFCFLPVLLVLACSSSTGPDDEGDHSGGTIAESAIDADGGTLETKQVSIEIPSGAFDSETTLAVTRSPEKSFDEAAVSDTYLITGMPAHFNEDLTVSLAADSEISGTTLLMVGMETWVSSIGRTDMAYRCYPAEVIDGVVTGTVPATIFSVAKASGYEADETTTLAVTAVTGMGPYVTPAGHFRIDYREDRNSLADIQHLGDCLEEAYDTYLAMGFSYDRRTEWPVSVTVTGDMNPETYGVYFNTLWGHNGGCMSFNMNRLSDHDEISVTAGHEFFHLVQSLYDPRNFFSRAKFESPHLWLDEACAVWAEEMFSDTPGYVSTVRAGNIDAPMNGVVAGAEENAGNHGYGLSSMIKYLADEYGEQTLVAAYEHLYDGDHPLHALIQATDAPLDWWEPFMRKYVLGDIYSVGISEFIGNRAGMFRIDAEDDTLETFTADYPDLSGRLYLVRLDNPGIDEQATAAFSVTGNTSEVTVFAYRREPASLEMAGASTGKVTVDNLRQLTDDGYHLLAMVVNSRNNSPYTGSSPITLTVKINSGEEFSQIILQLPYCWRSFETVKSDGTIAPPIGITAIGGPFTWTLDLSNAARNGNTYTGTNITTSNSNFFGHYKRTVEIEVTFTDTSARAHITQLTENYDSNSETTEEFEFWGLPSIQPAEEYYVASYGSTVQEIMAEEKWEQFTFTYHSVYFEEPDSYTRQKEYYARGANIHLR